MILAHDDQHCEIMDSVNKELSDRSVGVQFVVVDDEEGRQDGCVEMKLVKHDGYRDPWV